VSGDDKYLEAVLKESMRLHPVIASTARKLTRDMTIGGWDLPAGTVVYTSILLAHQRPESYPDTWTYRPDRFLGNEIEPNTWLPFGGGGRRCLGAGFSLMEGTAVLREILSHHTLTLPSGATPERGYVRNITNVPRRRAPVLVTPRPALATTTPSDQRLSRRERREPHRHRDLRSALHADIHEAGSTQLRAGRRRHGATRRKAAARSYAQEGGGTEATRRW